MCVCVCVRARACFGRMFVDLHTLCACIYARVGKALGIQGNRSGREYMPAFVYVSYVCY